MRARDEREGGEGACAGYYFPQLILNCELLLKFGGVGVIAHPHPGLLPPEKGRRLHASLYAVVRRVNPIASTSCFLNPLGSNPC